MSDFTDETWAAWLEGYEWGLLHGAGQQRLEDDTLAELAARIAVARVEVQADVRETARNAIRFIDIEAARKAAGSAYVPLRAAA